MLLSDVMDVSEPYKQFYKEIPDVIVHDFFFFQRNEVYCLVCQLSTQGLVLLRQTNK